MMPEIATWLAANNLSFETISFLVVAGFLAAFIDSAVGGGGLISLPALMVAGLPPSVALGTNKLAGTMSSLTSTISFIRSGKVTFGLVKYLFPLALVGSAIGAYTVKQFPPHFLKPLVVAMLVAVTIYTLIKKDWGKESTFTALTRKSGILIALAALSIGFYDGFFGPGTGSFLIFAFLFIGLDFVEAAGNAKVLNFASNIAALVSFMFFGLVNYAYGLPMGIAMIAGAIVGSQVAIRKGVAYVRPLFILVSATLIGKQVYDLL